MSWIELHRRSEQLALDANALLRQGLSEEARTLFLTAAEAEVAALEALEPDRERTIGITAVSAAALLYKSGDREAAADLAHKMLIRHLPTFAKHQLRSLLQSIWNEEAQRETARSFSGSQVQVSVRGDDILAGGAPLELVLAKVQAVQSIVLRVAELLNRVPLRRRGPPGNFIQEHFRPWLFQAPPGSYQFSVVLERPVQDDLFGTETVSVDQVIQTFLDIMRDACERPEDGLVNVVQAEDYRETLLRLTRNLAPTGRSIQEIELTPADQERPAVFSPFSRKAIGEVLRQARKIDEDLVGEERRLRGPLRALDLNRDWLEVQTVDGPTRVYGVSDTVDDVIGPMVNHEVTVRASIRRDKLMFIDIEADE